MAIYLLSVISKNPAIISSKMDDEVVMMSIEKGNYYGLNPVGAEIWDLLTESMTVSTLCEKLMAEFDVSQEQCEREVCVYLGKLLDEGLIFVKN